MYRQGYEANRHLAQDEHTLMASLSVIKARKNIQLGTWARNDDDLRRRQTGLSYSTYASEDLYQFFLKGGL